MRINRGYLNWGVFFVCLGGVPLLVQEGMIATGAAADLWRLWPFVIVGIGLGMILSRTPAYFVGGLVVAACFGLAFGGAIATGTHINCGGTETGGTAVTRTGTFEGAASVDLHVVCGSLTTTTADGNAWTASVSNPRSGAPVIDPSATRLGIRSDTGNSWWLDRGKDVVSLTLPRTPRLSLNLTLDAADATLGLAGANVGSIDTTINFGSATIDLGAGGTQAASPTSLSGTVNFGSERVTFASADANANYTVNLGSLEICFPDDVGVQIRSHEVLSGSNLSGQGYTRTGESDTWTSPDSTSKPHHAIIDVTTNLGSVNVHPLGGCK